MRLHVDIEHDAFLHIVVDHGLLCNSRLLCGTLLLWVLGKCEAQFALLIAYVGWTLAGFLTGFRASEFNF